MNAPKIQALHVVSGDLWAGAEVQAYNLLGEFQRRDDVAVVAVCLNEGRLFRELKESDVRCELLDESQLGARLILKGLKEILSRNSYDIVHSHRYKENVLSGLAVGANSRSRLVKTVHGMVEKFSAWNALKMELYDALDRAVTNIRFHGIHCVSEDIRRSVSDRHPDLTTACIHNGVTLDTCLPKRGRAETLSHLSISDSARVLVVAGRLVGIKGIDTLLAALPTIVGAYPDAHLIVVGEGPDRTRLEQISHSMDLQDHAHFTGYRDDIIDLIAAADVFVLPSWNEGVPMVLLESMAVETPIVASRVGGIPEILRDQETALLIPAGDVSRLAEACIQLLKDDGRASQQAKKARADLEAHLTASAMAEKMIRFYRTLQQ